MQRLPSMYRSSRCQVRGQRGVMLIFAVALLFNVTIVGLYILEWTRIGVGQSLAFEGRIQATYLAEAGTNAALVRLADENLMDEIELPWEIFPETRLDEGTFKAELINNPGDRGGATDTDDVMVLKVVGWSHNRKHRRELQTYLQRSEKQPLLPATCTVGSGTTAHFAGQVTIDGQDVDNPSVTVPGVAFESGDQSLRTSASVTVTGNPAYQWGSSSGGAQEGFGAQVQGMLESFANDPGAVHMDGKSSTSLGTEASPQITVVDAGASLKLSKTLTGYGVLVIRGELQTSAKMTFHGVVLVEGEGGYLKAANSFDVFGALVMTPRADPSSEPREAVKCTGHANILYQASQIDLYLSSGSDQTHLLQVRSSAYQN